MTPCHHDSLRPDSGEDKQLPFAGTDKNQLARCCVRRLQRRGHPGTNTIRHPHVSGRYVQLTLPTFPYFIGRKQVQELKQIKQMP